MKAIFYCLAFLVLTIGVRAQTPFTIVTAPGTTVNYVTGDLGGKFNNVSGTTVVITQLGRWVVSGNTASHTLKIWDSSHGLIDQVSVNTVGAPSGQFLYGTLPLGPV